MRSSFNAPRADTTLSVVVQVRICTRLGVQLVSTDFNNKEYYANIRKAMLAGYFMQVCQPLSHLLLI